MKELGLSPRHVIDDGGNHGNWTRAVREFFPQANVTMLEPQTELAVKHADLAADEQVVIHYAGAGDQDGTATFTFHDRDDSSSFIYDAAEAEARGYVQSSIEMRRLDTVVADSPFGAPEIVKIDAEGFDLEVLKGATETLQTASFVLIEASVSNPDYANTVLVVLQEMDRLGFKLLDITDLNRTPGRGVLWLIEGVFVRKDSPIAKSVTTFN